jgi:HAD superfamily hydrolase (TIGR01549 family)
MSDAPIVCFDIGGTLLDHGPSFAQAVQGLVGRPLLQAEWDEYVNLAMGSAEDDLARIAERFELDFAALLRVYHDHLGHERRLFDEVSATLEALAHCRCVALSNTARWLTTNLCGAEVYLAKVFYSHDIRFAKPDPRAFRFVEKQLGARPENILMVGDSLTYDYQAARGAGWRAVLLDRQGRHAGDDSIDRIGSLTELPGRLPSPERADVVPSVVEIAGEIERSGATIFIQVPAALLEEQYTARPVRVHNAFGSCRARLVRGNRGGVVLLLSESQHRALGLSESDRDARLSLSIIAEKLQLLPPPELDCALRDAGLSWEAVPERDRHLLVGLVREAKTAELRQARVRRIVSSLQGRRDGTAG